MTWLGDELTVNWIRGKKGQKNKEGGGTAHQNECMSEVGTNSCRNQFLDFIIIMVRLQNIWWTDTEGSTDPPSTNTNTVLNTDPNPIFLLLCTSVCQWNHLWCQIGFHSGGISFRCSKSKDGWIGKPLYLAQCRVPQSSNTIIGLHFCFPCGLTFWIL